MMSHQVEVVHEEEEEEEVAPFWMISFSDMMTLLLTFFIMLYTISTMNASKAQSLSNSMQRQFGYKANMYHVMPGARFENGSDGNREKKEGQDEPLVVQLPKLNTHSTKELVSHGMVLFPFASDELSMANQKAIKDILPHLEGIPQKIELRGRASPDEQSQGFANDLMDLAYSRAHRVRTFLVDLGIKSSRIEIKLLDPSAPIAQENEQRIDGINSSVEIWMVVDANR